MELLFDAIFLTLTYFLVLLEAFITGVTLLLPSSVLEWFTAQTRSILSYIPQQGERAYSDCPQVRARVNAVRDAESFIELCKIFGYESEEHVVPTRDGYLLGIHRITGKKLMESKTTNTDKPCVYLHHGLLMTSEVWVAVGTPNDSLAFVLADLGYDVWLGNNRGNKYSKKHLTLSPRTNEFWNFGLDEFALYDVPDTIKYILDTTKQPNLSYVGFSQGSAQGFASFALYPELSTHVNLFIALGPAMAPPGINPMMQSFMNASPGLLYLIFGRRILLRSTVVWQSIMQHGLYVRAIDVSCRLLFNWKSARISYARKLMGYYHLYSFTSVKTVVHWFQCIRRGRLQVYDDDTIGPFALSRYCQVHRYPTTNIKIPIHIYYGTADSLVSVQSLRDQLPTETQFTPMDGYEHLDLLWGDSVSTEVIPGLVESLESVTDLRRNKYFGGSIRELKRLQPEAEPSNLEEKPSLPRRVEQGWFPSSPSSSVQAL